MTIPKNISFLHPMIEKFQMGGGLLKKEDKKETCASADNDYGTMFLKFLWVRDQAHIFHWQAKMNSHHVILGSFYEDYLEELDELAETIFGKTGKTFTIGSGTMNFKDYSEENLKMYLQKVPMIFGEYITKQFPNIPENAGIYHVIGDILEVINKMRYLMSQK